MFIDAHASNKEILKELKFLGKRHPLKASDLERAKILMGALKFRGYTNKEISYSVGGTWSIPTIKLYTRKLLPGRNITSRESLSAILDALLRHRLSVEDIKAASNLNREIDTKGLNIEDVAFVINEANRFGMSVREVWISWRGLRELNLKSDEIRNLLDIRRDLNNHNISASELSKILSICAAAGGKDILLRKLGLIDGPNKVDDSEAKPEKSTGV